MNQINTLEDLELANGSFQKEINDQIIAALTETILHYVTRPEVEEVFINRPHEIWLKLRKHNRMGSLWERVAASDLSYDNLVNTFHHLANVAGTSNFGPFGNPVTNNTLPGGHRYIAAYGPNFQYWDKELDPNGTVLFACRQNTMERKSELSHWGLQRGKPLAEWQPEAARRADSNDPIIKLLNIIKRGEHLLISGETGTGKTTLINKLLTFLPEDTRICAVQDTLELKIPQKNRFIIFMNRQETINKFTYKSVIDMIVRANTDTNIYGEVSAANAPYIIEAANTGNACFITSIHADSADNAVSAYIDRYQHERPLDSAGRQRLEEQVRKTFHVVQIVRDRETNERRIVQIT